MSENNSTGDSSKLMRLSKLMTEKGLCSRREADELISQGLVYVNGEKVNQLGHKVTPDVRVTLDPKALRRQKELVTILVNKPVGIVSAQAEDGYVPAVELIQEENFFSEDGSPPEKNLTELTFQGLAVVGRLDIDSHGLLIFTQDGRLVKKIIGETVETEKEYLVRIDTDNLDIHSSEVDHKLALLRHGLELDGKSLKPAKVEWLNENQLRVILVEGKKRQIRRMCELVGLKILGLKRVRIGNIKLGKLPLGKWRYLKSTDTL